MLTRPPATQTSDVDAQRSGRAQWAGVLALLSLAAGFLHAAVIDGHRGHGIVSQVFTAVAIFQVAWAALVLARPSRAVLLLGAVGNAAVAVGWLVQRTVGLSFLDGLEDPEPVGFTDGATAALEVLLVGSALLLLLVSNPERRLWPAGRVGFAGLGATGLAVALVAVPATASAGDHVGNGHDSRGGDVAAAVDHGDHAEGDEAAEDHGDHAEGDAAAAGHDDHAEMGYFDALESATPEQREAADKLLADTRDGLWQWVDDTKVYEAGFRTINDGFTGTEHMVNWTWINDDKVLDPNYPESLVYRVEDGVRTLEAAMFMAPAGTPDDEVPDVGGPITQWHIHNNLCYSPSTMVDGFPQRSVINITSAPGVCPTGEYLSPHAPMLHVWTVEQNCGPFSSLEGVGAGQAIQEEADPNDPKACQHSEH